MKQTKILNLETATRSCSVAVCMDGQCAAQREINTGQYNHAEKLHVFIEQVLKQTGLRVDELDGVAVSRGPGSYTGLRIGVSAAKGLAFAAGIPLISVDTLAVMASAVVQTHPQCDLFVPMIDARRMEVFCCTFDRELNIIEKTSAKIVDENSFSDILKDHKVCFFGDGADKCRQAFAQNWAENAYFAQDVFPSATQMGAFAQKAFEAGQFEDVAYFEPFYLKDFVAGVRKSPRV